MVSVIEQAKRLMRLGTRVILGGHERLDSPSRERENPDVPFARGPLEERRDRMLEDVDLNASILEIGPLDRPLAVGPNVRYADHMLREDLLKKYTTDSNVTLDRIPHVHYVIRSLDDYKAIPNRFDTIIASHVIEHAPDFVGWINVLLDLLKPEGKLVLAVPDRRYSLDVLRRESELSEALEAYVEERRRPNFRQVFDHVAGISDVLALDLWNGIANPKRQHPPELAYALARTVEKGAYHDVHCWVFTFDSFLSMIDALNALGVLHVKVLRALPPIRGANEFLVTLARSLTRVSRCRR